MRNELVDDLLLHERIQDDLLRRQRDWLKLWLSLGRRNVVLTSVVVERKIGSSKLLGSGLRHNHGLLQHHSLLRRCVVGTSSHGMPERPFRQPQAALLKSVAAVPPAPVIDPLRAARPLQALKLQRHVASIVQPDIAVELLPDIIEGRMGVREANILQNVWYLSREAVVINGVEGNGEDVLEHLGLCHLAIADDYIALEGRIEPYPHLACLIDADHLLINWKEADHLAQLPEPVDADIQQVDHIRVRHILNVGQSQRHWFDDHSLCISRWLLDCSFAHAVASLASV